jgi:hypothetical protein
LPYQYISGAAYPKGRTTRHVPFFVIQPLAQKYAGKMRNNNNNNNNNNKKKKKKKKTMFKAKHCIDKRKIYRKEGVTLTIILRV